ncbi:exodeoxyribonuclease V subunit beta [Salinispirillum sp. LH 10-3-1]|uniref:RecBCD enzyme subunit RecB n=1 Tax=Salinispirillum sp. LH 10-3-1 TaxID=2952525 RepID=A0AB38YJ31_9GAMM
MNERMPQPLVAEEIPLTGRHLIEASAGTGKTYNITRLYARLLLEQKLSVQQILVVTFTRAATEELRGRVASYLRELLHQWGSPDADDFAQTVRARLTDQEARLRLRDALQNLDEAAIYTIHGYCKRVLTQQAFASGIPFEVTMEADTSELVLQVTADAWRRLAQEPERYCRVTERFPTPDKFYQAFRQVLTSEARVEAETWEDLQQLKQVVLQGLHPQLEFLRNELIRSRKKPAEVEQREGELADLLSWLADAPELPIPASVASFLHGRRYPKRADIAEVLEPVKALKDLPERCHKSAVNAELIALLNELRTRIQHEKQRQRVLDFNDLVTQLRDALQGAQGAALAHTLAETFPAALLDEFQDTDPQQYAIFDAVYQSPETALYMIGDPKQAIYSFRGGDVYAYLQAGQTADYLWSMDTNFRSSPTLIQGYNRLFYGAPVPEDEAGLAPSYRVFGAQIGYRPVKDGGIASKANKTPLHEPAAEQAPAALQLVHFPLHLADQEKYFLAEFRQAIAAWCAQEVQRLMGGHVRRGEQPLQEADIAFLVRSKTEAEVMQEALRAAGFASVFLSARDNVLQSPEAVQLEKALTGILYAEDDRLLLAALVSPLFGLTAQDILALQDDEHAWEQQRTYVLGLREQWQRHGFITMALNLVHDRYRPDAQQRERHERAMTNMLHLLELLQQASQQESEPWQLLEWLRLQQRSNLSRQEVELRLESDANLIRIITQHSSKGLEYPIVFVPFATYGASNRATNVMAYHDRNGDMVWRLGAGDDATKAAQREQEEERVRLLYVAVTRAEQRCYLCVANFARPQTSALGLALGLPLAVSQGATTEQGEEASVSSDPWPDALRTLCATDANQSRADMGWTKVEQLVETIPIAPTMDHQAPPTVSTFAGRIERHWGLSSFSALARSLTQAQVGYGDLSRRDRDQQEAGSEELTLRKSADRLAMRFRLPKGARAGNLLHDTLEHMNFTDPDWSAVAQRAQEHFGQLFSNTAALTDLQVWLQACLNTPLNAEGLSLSQLGLRQTLREAEFYFPLHGSTGRDLARLLQAHRRSVGKEDAASVELPARQLEGMMHGFIDLIFVSDGRYYVCDYKSTWLGDQLSAYTPDALQRNIEQHWYDLQYLIYSLALHRYLQQRIPDYRMSEHFGGVYYLYLRGMAPESPGTGVNFVRPDPSIIERLDALVGAQPEEGRPV